MDYKEKLKLAKEALDSDSYDKETIEYIFPELVESEDERIKKELLDFCKNRAENYPNDPKYRNISSWIAWLEKQGKNNMGISEATKQKLENNLNKALEKETPESWNKFLDEQGEQNPADKVEPKFKVGDWIIHNKNTKLANSLMLVTSKNNNKYLCKDIDGQCSYNIEFIDKDYHLWTIQDAKDGDVLAAHECLVLFKEIDGLNIRCYCTYHFMNNTSFYVDTLQNKEAFHPATKEQRNTLMKAITEAGYEWDAEKKELRKIEQNLALSKEDEKTIHLACEFIRHHTDPKDSFNGINCSALIERLKSLKERYTWKPSDEQMEVLNWCKPLWNEPKTKAVLESLIEDLKKLRGK